MRPSSHSVGILFSTSSLLTSLVSMQAPPGYVAGLGRGASGFTTRSDIGPAREAGTMEEAVSDLQSKEIEPDQFQDPENETGLFAGTVYDKDDEEADKIYDMIDQRMDEKGRARREASEKKAQEAYLAANPKIQTQFSDLKRSLATVSEEEWGALPEAGNITGKRRKNNTRNDGKTYVVPDSVLAGARDRNDVNTSIDDEKGVATPASSGTVTDFREIGQARDKSLSLRLDQLGGAASSTSNATPSPSSTNTASSSASTSGTSGTSTSVDPKGYLTGLNSVQLKTDAEIGDIKKARALLESVIKTNPKHAPGWIAAGRVEEVAGRMAVARKVIAAGCDNCPKSEDVWLEAARLNIPQDARVILANAVSHLPQSVKIWLKAVDLENDPKSKRRVLRKAIEYIPNSVRLWKEAVNMEDDPQDALILLARATELIPSSVELWLALARLETPDNAKKIINKARKTIPTSHEIWIAASRLQEQIGASSNDIDKLMNNGVGSLRSAGALLSREQWLKEAEKVEEEGSPLTCAAIVKATVYQEIEEEDRYAVWMDDADALEDRGSIETARAVIAFALKVFPERSKLWRRAAELEKQHGDRKSLTEILKTATQYCPKAEVLWLMLAKEHWLGGDVNAARQVLGDAFNANPSSEAVWLAAVKLEAENKEIKNARMLLNKARLQSGTERIWMKSAVFERQHGDKAKALEYVNQAIEKYPKFDKLYMIKVGLIDQSQHKEIRDTFTTGLKLCPHSVPLWILASQFEERMGVIIRSRALLEKARLTIKNSDILWAEAIKVEERANAANQAKALLSKALQECPNSGILWSIAIWMEPRPSRKTKSVDALRKVTDDPTIIVTVARTLWMEGKKDKARSWLSKSCKADPDNGDHWAWWYKFELQDGTKENAQAVLDNAKQSEPHHGQIWQSVIKDDQNLSKPFEQLLRITASKLS
ncbi:hypothetical protein E3Q23_03114 [Wallemia mellicola]|uniref:Pre-mRNA-splicing factor prp1 n=1 Tax=Wallemia mellicola TaxID=1708541 RepID=A0A4T0TF42_9BASI|nr:hypothetical protein E3Q23_03114 [Wallemia mellicola]TIC28511.1 pre-mRNA-splicing factor prp1 [Wallemia mellicola]TIC63816.1 pre-mRNA-splicing factor prp1 [Wallemia mellicola]